MSYLRVGLAALGGFVAYFVLGGLSFVVAPSLKNEFLKYPMVYRTQDAMKSVMPIGMLAMLVAMVAWLRFMRCSTEADPDGPTVHALAR